jgi:ribonuclease Z
MAPSSLRFGELRIEGASRAGEETWFRVHPPGLAFDVGRGHPVLAGARDLFLTHGHLDHASGVAYVLSQRSLHRDETTRVICPAPVAEGVVDLLEASSRLEGVSYRYEVVASKAGDRISVGKNLEVGAFATDHVVPSLGYHLIRRKSRLAPEFRGLEPDELVALKKAGKEIEQEEEEIWLSYCGDTAAGVFAGEPRLFASKILLIECTFMTDELRDSSASYKHLHLEDLAERAGEFHNEALVLHHLSRRHRPEELRAEIDRRMPTLAPRIHLFPASAV